MKPTIGRIVIYQAGANDLCGIEGSELPAVIVRVHTDSYVNLKVFTDGRENQWVTSVLEGEGSRMWHWPSRA